MNTGLNTRGDKIDYLKHLEESGNSLSADIMISFARLDVLKMSINILLEEVRLDDLVVFCQTGRYPDEA